MKINSLSEDLASKHKLVLLDEGFGKLTDTTIGVEGSRKEIEDGNRSGMDSRYKVKGYGKFAKRIGSLAAAAVIAFGGGGIAKKANAEGQVSPTPTIVSGEVLENSKVSVEDLVNMNDKEYREYVQKI